MELLISYQIVKRNFMKLKKQLLYKENVFFEPVGPENIWKALTFF